MKFLTREKVGALKTTMVLEFQKMTPQRPILTIAHSQEMGYRPILKLIEPVQVMFSSSLSTYEVPDKRESWGIKNYYSLGKMLYGKS